MKGISFLDLDHYNKNGLVEGMIVKGTACPFIEECECVMARCPTKDNIKEVDFSCALARLRSATRECG